MRVYAGTDPVSGKEHYLRETVPAGPTAESEARKVRTRLVAAVDERRHPRTNAKLRHLIERHLNEAKLELNTRETYQGYVDKHVLPFIGDEPAGKIDEEILDSLYAELARCREHCDGKGGTDHRTAAQHDCDHRCRRHVCRPLADSTIRQIHWILSGAFRRGVRWKWIGVNPAATSEPPPAPRGNPDPPSAEDAARIVNAAWESDLDWGMLIWLTMVTGHRRGELCAIKLKHLDLDNRVLHIGRSIGQRGRKRWEKSTKAQADRRVVLDVETVELLKEHVERWRMRLADLGMELNPDLYIFSLSPDGATERAPDSVTQRFGRLVAKLGIDTTLHKLRHYNATELIAAGVNIRTVAGRLGHGSGGMTTLRSYAAWVSEADQRAAGEIAARMPPRPRVKLPERPVVEGTNPYELIAVSLSERIYAGEIGIGLPIPSVKQLSKDFAVSTSTAQRAIKLLESWGLVRVATGRPTIVLPAPHGDGSAGKTVGRQRDVPPTASSPRALDLEVRRLGTIVATLTATADPTNTKSLHRLLLGAIKRAGASYDDVDEYELVVRLSGTVEVVTTYVAIEP
ncbi:GntR family transcriptional regulator [Jiangella rhizosphaerae]|uniref:GntR family transcriptional regulator n=1 Tax=Jiangella rhizosphaerae TaxID=2293569 RepID=A0A418KSX7_9ACTN|nr:GntR family transcriptional regulator [Jiangella rhizosphaerae]